jgi:hypothetical protein
MCSNLITWIAGGRFRLGKAAAIISLNMFNNVVGDKLSEKTASSPARNVSSILGTFSLAKKSENPL